MTDPRTSGGFPRLAAICALLCLTQAASLHADDGACGLFFDRDQNHVATVTLPGAPPPVVLPFESYTIACLIRTEPGWFAEPGACDLPTDPCAAPSLCEAASTQAFVLSLEKCVSEGTGRAWMLWVRPSGRLALSYDLPDGSDERLDSGVHVADGEWHLVAASRDAATGEVTLFVDGHQVSCSDTETASAPCDPRLAIGARLNDGGLPAGGFPGFIDEVTVWSSAVPRTVLDGVRNGAVDLDHPDLVGHWRLDEGTGQVLADSSPNGLHAVLGLTDQPEPGDDPLWTPGVAPPLPLRDAPGFEGVPMAYSLTSTSPVSSMVRTGPGNDSFALADLGPYGPLPDPSSFNAPGVDVDAFSLGQDIIPASEDGILLRAIPVPVLSFPFQGMALLPVWGGLVFSGRDGNGHDGRTVFGMTWGMRVRDDLSGELVSDGGVLVARGPDEMNTTQDVDGMDLTAFRYEISEVGDLFWDPITGMAGPPGPPSVYFSVTQDTAHLVPPTWLTTGDPATGGTVFVMEWVDGAWQGPRVSHLDLGTLVADDPSVDLAGADIDALAYDERRGFVVFSTVGAYTGDEPGQPAPFLFRDLAQPLARSLRMQVLDPDGADPMLIGQGQVRDVADVVTDIIGAFDPDGVSIDDPSLAFLPPVPCTEVDLGSSPISVPQEIAEWTVARHEGLAGGIRDLSLSTYLTRVGDGFGQTLVVRGGLEHEQIPMGVMLSLSGGTLELENESGQPYSLLDGLLVASDTLTPQWQATTSLPAGLEGLRFHYQVTVGDGRVSNVVSIPAPEPSDTPLVPRPMLVPDPAKIPGYIDPDGRLGKGAGIVGQGSGAAPGTVAPDFNQTEPPELHHP